MKKYFLIIPLATLIIPSVAFASWWNPFSWFNSRNSRTTDTKTQVLESRIVELEKKLADTASTTPKYNFDSSTTTIASTTVEVPPKPAAKKPEKSLAPAKVTPTYSPTVVTPAPSVPVDKYGMTENNWATMISSISKFRDMVNSNSTTILQKNSYISTLDEGARTVSTIIGSQSMLDDTGKIYAQVYLDITQKLKAGYQNEINLRNEINSNFNQVISAVYNHDKDTMDRLLNEIFLKTKQIDVIIEQDYSLLAQHTDAFKTFSDYFTLYAKFQMEKSSYSQTNSTSYTPSTYVPVYVPPTQYNTNCTTNSNYAGTGGTVNCTSYTPSSSAIDECAKELNRIAPSASVNARYAKCLEEHSR
jgi:hypothetical protein